MIQKRMLNSAIVLAAMIMGLVLPVPSKAAGACEAFSQTESFDELARLVAEKRHGIIETNLYRAIVGEACEMNEIISMMERMGWTYRRNVEFEVPNKISEKIEYNRVIIFCDTWSFPRSIFGGCGGVAYIYTMNDEIVYLAAGGNI
jgi:hypothetical protein